MNANTYYQDLEKKAGDTQDSHDYDALDQGPVGTGIRHDAVARALGHYIRNGSLLDLGCGTGLLLQSLFDKGLTPASYVGVDFMRSREKHVMRRCGEAGIPGVFKMADLTDTASWKMQGRMDVLTMIGVVGPVPFNSLSTLFNMMRVMPQRATHGMVSVPRQRLDHLGEPGQAHFHADDVQALVHAFDIKVKMLIPSAEAHDLFLWW